MPRDNRADFESPAIVARFFSFLFHPLDQVYLAAVVTDFERVFLGSRRV